MSTVAHVAVGVGLFTTGVWQLEQLDRPRHRLQLDAETPPRPPAPTPVRREPGRRCFGDGSEDAVASVCGNHAREAGEQCDDGNSANGDGCSASCQTEFPTRSQSLVISPSVLTGLRITGTTLIRPSASIQNQMSRGGESRVIGSVKLCISTDGSIASASTIKPTKYDDYDRALLSTVRTWRFRPYTVNGVAVKACSVVTFVYTVQ